MNKIKKNDEVIVIAGRDKGKKGAVKQVLQKDRLVVEGINIVKRHVKADPNKSEKGGIVEQESTIHKSNVMLVNPETDKGDRIGIRVNDNGQRERYYKSNEKVVG